MGRMMRISLWDGMAIESERNRYTIEKRISMNDSSMTYLCRDVSGTAYRLKLYNGKNCMKGRTRSIFLSMKKQPGVMLPIDYGAYEGVVFDVLPYVGNTLSIQTISDFITIKMIIGQLAEAIHSLHNYGIILRNLSEEGVLFDEETQKVFIDNFSEIALLENGATGTKRPIYHRDEVAIPPEYFEDGDGKPGDYYALGKLLQWLLFGEKAEPRSPDNKWSRINMQYISERERLELLMQGLLIRNPEQRWGIDEVRQCIYSKKKEERETEENPLLRFSSLSELANTADYDTGIRDVLRGFLLTKTLSKWIVKDFGNRISDLQCQQIGMWEAWEKQVPFKGCFRMIAQMKGKDSFKFRYREKSYGSLTELLRDADKSKLNMLDICREVVGSIDFEAWGWIHGKENAVLHMKTEGNRDILFSQFMCLAEELEDRQPDRQTIRLLYLKHSNVGPIYWLQTHLAYYRTEKPDGIALFKYIQNYPLTKYQSIEEIDRYLAMEMERYMQFVQKTQQGEIVALNTYYQFSKACRGVPVPEAYLV